MRPEHAARFERILGEVCNAISFTLIGNIVISVIAGTVVGVAAVIVGAPSPMVLALIVGLLDLDPADRGDDRRRHRDPVHADRRRARPRPRSCSR